MSRGLAHGSGRGSARVAYVCVAVLLATAAPARATSCLPTTLVVLARQSPAIFEATVQAVAASDDERRPLFPGAPPAPPDMNPMVVATLAEVQPLSGMRVDRLLASPGMLLPGQRYVFITHPSQRPGLVAIGGCGGIARPTAYAAELRRWITSLDSAPAGGRVVGAVLLRRWGDPDPGGAPFQTVEGARVTLRGPVNREATAGAHGEYAFTGLPDGDYALAVQPPAGPMVADARFVLRASLSGGHAAAIVDAFVAVQGVITDESATSVSSPSSAPGCTCTSVRASARQRTTRSPSCAPAPMASTSSGTCLLGGT